MLNTLTKIIPGAIGVSGPPPYTVTLSDGSSRAVAGAELLDAARASRIEQINAECRARLLSRYGPAEEQVSRSIGVYGATEQSAMQAGIAATIDASNTASNAVLAATDIAAVEAVSVSWPVI